VRGWAACRMRRRWWSERSGLRRAWKVHTPKDSPAKGLVLYWFRRLRTSGRIRVCASRAAFRLRRSGVTMEVGTNQTPERREKFSASQSAGSGAGDVGGTTAVSGE